MRARERGQVLVLFALALVALIGMGAIGIDVGYMYSARHELQRCADAGALAGASAFLVEDWASEAGRTIADARGRAYASRDNVVTAPLDPAGEVQVSFPARDRVQVDTTRDVGLFFSRLFLGPSRQITAYAIAESSVADRNVRGLKPWVIPYPWEDTNGNGRYDEGETVHTDCPPGVVDPSSYFCQGTRVILKIGNPYGSPGSDSLAGTPSLQQESGHFFALDFGSGASGYRDSIENTSGTSGPAISKGDYFPLETGNMVGPTTQGARTLIQMDPDSTWNQTANLPESGSYSVDGDAWMNSPRIVRIPIYDPREPPATGKSEVHVAGFAGFWIERIESQGTIIGRFVPVLVTGGGGPSEGPVEGPVARTLRLVE